MAELNIIEAIRDGLDFEMSRDERVMILGLDVAALGGVFRATDGLFAKYGRDRVVNTPLAEATIIGASLGLAISGLVPVAELQFAGFAHQAFHQLGPQLGRYRFRSRGRFNAQVTVRAPFGGGVKTPEFHPDAIEAQLAQTPGLKIVCPNTPYDAKGMLLEAIRDPDPVMFLEPQRLYRKSREEVPEGDYTVPFGKSILRREGTQVTLIAWSAAVELCERAADQLAADVCLGCGSRSSDAGPTGRGGTGCGGREDRPLRGRPRGALHRRIWSRGDCDHPGGGLLLARCTDHAGRRLGHAVPTGLDRGLVPALS